MTSVTIHKGPVDLIMLGQRRMHINLMILDLHGHIRLVDAQEIIWGSGGSRAIQFLYGEILLVILLLWGCRRYYQRAHDILGPFNFLQLDFDFGRVVASLFYLGEEWHRHLFGGWVTHRLRWGFVLRRCLLQGVVIFYWGQVIFLLDFTHFDHLNLPERV